jgi:DNA-binding NarL/FixJ family response regulator
MLSVVADHVLRGHALVAAFREVGVDAEVVPAAGELDVLAAVARRRPDVVLLDLDVGEPVGEGATLVAPLQDLGVKVLVVTGLGDPGRVSAAIEAGADGIVARSAPVVELVAAARQLVGGASVIGEAARIEVEAALRRQGQREHASRRVHRQLTAREREVLTRLADGETVKAIADDLVVSEATVRSQVRGILTKLGVGSQLEAVALASRSGWIPPQRSG